METGEIPSFGGKDTVHTSSHTNANAIIDTNKIRIQNNVFRPLLFSLKFKVFNVPSVTWTCSIVPQQDVVGGQKNFLQIILIHVFPKQKAKDFPFPNFPKYLNQLCVIQQ